MTTLRIAPHTDPKRGHVVEIHHPVLGLLGVIYPTERGVRLISKYLDPKRTYAPTPGEFPPVVDVEIGYE